MDLVKAQAYEIEAFLDNILDVFLMAYISVMPREKPSK
ncbi:hypothetical protein N752_06575 [Desulforamulus aquiferis]|nr:hypothetical protein N752_06575 [Desulforamulus aquiferis]